MIEEFSNFLSHVPCPLQSATAMKFGLTKPDEELPRRKLFIKSLSEDPNSIVDEKKLTIRRSKSLHQIEDIKKKVPKEAWSEYAQRNPNLPNHAKGSKNLAKKPVSLLWTAKVLLKKDTTASDFKRKQQITKPFKLTINEKVANPNANQRAEIEVNPRQELSHLRKSNKSSEIENVSSKSFGKSSLAGKDDLTSLNGRNIFGKSSQKSLASSKIETIVHNLMPSERKEWHRKQKENPSQKSISCPELKVNVNSERRQSGDMQVFTFSKNQTYSTEGKKPLNNDYILNHIHNQNENFSSMGSIELTPKYSGYKPENGICFITFKKMFTKPPSGFRRGTLLQVKREHKGIIATINTPFEMLSDDKIELCLQNTEPQFNEKERMLIEQTRKEIREQILATREVCKIKESENKKVKLNIFLKSRFESASMESSVDVVSNVSKDTDEDTLEETAKSSNPQIVCTAPSEDGGNPYCTPTSCDQSSQDFPPIIAKEPERENDNFMDEGVQQFKRLGIQDTEDVPTLMSLQNHSTSTGYSDFDDDNYISKEPSMKEADLTNNEENDYLIVSKPPKLQGNFLKTIISESKHYSRQARNFTPKDFKRKSFSIKTHYNSLESEEEEDDEEEQLGYIFPKTNRVSSGYNKSTAKSSSDFTAEYKDQLCQAANTQALLENYNTNAMQAFRKKIEESRELHRRLHFCGIQVSKETVMRALMSPGQWKMYESLHQCPEAVL